MNHSLMIALLISLLVASHAVTHQVPCFNRSVLEVINSCLELYGQEWGRLLTYDASATDMNSFLMQ